MTTLRCFPRLVMTGLLFAAFGQAAQAAVCTGQAPAVGAEIQGPVLHVPDAASLCVALGMTPDHWVEVRLADAPAALASPTSMEARSILMEAAFAQNVVCRIVASDDRSPAAICQRDGRSIGEAVSPPTAVKASQTWR